MKSQGCTTTRFLANFRRKALNITWTTDRFDAKQPQRTQPCNETIFHIKFITLLLFKTRGYSIAEGSIGFRALPACFPQRHIISVQTNRAEIMNGIAAPAARQSTPKNPNYPVNPLGHKRHKRLDKGHPLALWLCSLDG